jgi:glycosyltransferase involved in cell wall biosynthesis
VKKEISIIIPVYNVEKYLSETLNSILSQEFSNYEIILINDGSTDSTGIICDEFSKKYNFIQVFHQVNAGVSVARNKGIDLAKGDYIWFVDGDDLVAKNALNKLHDLLKEYNYELDVLGFSFISLTENKRIPFEKKEFLVPVNGDAFLKHYERLALWTFLYKRTLIVNNNLKFVEGISVFEDNLFNIEVFSMSKNIVQTNYHLYLYRTDREGSAMATKDFTIDPILKSILLILNTLKTIKTKTLSKETSNKINLSFWNDFLYYFDKIKNKKNRNEISVISKTLYLKTDYLKTTALVSSDVNFDIIVFNIFKTNYLFIRHTLLTNFLKAIVVKFYLFFNHKNH